VTAFSGLDDLTGVGGDGDGDASVSSVSER
jgi:hypothetical protein